MQTRNTKLRDLVGSEGLIATTCDTLQSVAQRMASIGATAIPVTKFGKAVGILTERDFVHKVVAAGLDPAQTLVVEVMTSDPTIISEDRDLESAMLVIRVNQAQALVVQDFTGRVLGAVTECDLLVAGGGR